jgi:TRAP-type mannitol/chloroaromatic compound transport system, small permease component
MSDKTTKLDTSDEMIAERKQGSAKMPDDMPKWMASLITKIDLFSKWTGNIVCWITVPLILAMVYEVIARKIFTAPTMGPGRSRFLYGAQFMLGAGYAYLKGHSTGPKK